MADMPVPSGNTQILDGKLQETTLIAMMALPSAKAAGAFVSDHEYAPYAATRWGGSDSWVQLIGDTVFAIETS
jgi:uncharacterized protein (DUF1330 family)